ncbi:ATP-binding cassette domain-containing protein [Streptomyces sp. NPDC052020]|uniref:ABC transporter ATP-binding protein n=1 Tax=Streptomyces sp. NPDC052020 TaxID=3155677 RepID=UPI003433FDD3
MTPSPGTTAATAMISARNLTKDFRIPVRATGKRAALRALARPAYTTRRAVHELDLDVERGELLAFLGPNGAGKSTTIKMLTGVLTPTSGTLHVAGRVPHANRAANARTIGVVFGQRSQLWWDLPGRDSFDILRDMYGLARREYTRRLGECDELLGLSQFWNTPARHMSLGQRVRCDLAAALLHDPKVLFLDEPTIGMDVVVKEQVRGFLRQQVAERHRTVVLTTHDMLEVDRLAHRVALINHGRLVFDGPLDALRSRFGTGWRLRVTFEEPPGDVVLPGVRATSQGESTLTFTPDGTRTIRRQDVVRQLVARFRVLDITTADPETEDVIRAAYRIPGTDDRAPQRSES